jgi:isopenicillin N synthase-like dioxygenase
MGQIEKLARELLELLTEGLGLERDRFNHYVEKERMMSMRFNLYPPCPQPELAIGLRAHTDPHLLTILHQDEVAGLQVFIDEQWVTVKPLPDCFVVNVGDLFQVPAPFPTSVSNEKKKNNPQKKHS